MQTPKTIKVGDTVDCLINKKPAQITWKDADTLVIEPDDPRQILNTQIDGEYRVFMCAHAGSGKEGYVVEKGPGGVVVSAPLDPETDDQERESRAILIDSKTREVRSVSINGYDGINELMGESSHPEGATLCQFKGNVYLQTWADCEEYLVGPAFASSLNPLMPIHGLTVIDAYDLSTGEAVDCPISAEYFQTTIEWEEVQLRVDPARPNPDWIKRFHLDNVKADTVVQYGD